MTRDPRPFRPADLLKQVMLQAVALSPDGGSVVYGRRTIERGQYRSRLWRVPYAGGRSEQLTSGEADGRPRFSPDGGTLLFLSRRSGRGQPWLLPLGGGEPRQLAEFPGEARSAEWSPDGSRVVVVADSGEERFLIGEHDDPIARRIDALTWRLDGMGVRDQFASAYVVGAGGGKPVRVTEPAYEVDYAFWSPDGDRVGFLADLRPEAALTEYAQAWSVPADGGRPRELATLAGQIMSASWSPGGRLALLGVDIPEAPNWANVNLYVLDGGRPRQLAGDLDRNLMRRSFSDLVDVSSWLPPVIEWLDEDHVVCLAAERGRAVPCRVGLDGSAEYLAEGDVVCSALAVRASRAVVVANDRGRPGEVYAIENGRLRPLTRHGSAWLAPFRRDPERFRIPHADGHEIDAWLVPARGARRRKRLVLQIHGGPHSAHPPAPWLEMLALADAGISVVYSNPRGSVGYGQDFAGAIDGDWGERDSSDLLRVVDWALEEGHGESGLVGVLGLSYGGYMTNWLLGHYPGRFAAGVSENPVTDLLAEYAQADLGTWIGPIAAGVRHPSDDLARLLDRSPATEIHRNEAPLLLLHAEGDLRCPPGQSELVFTILRQLGRPVELVRYPGEPHVLVAVGRPDRRVDRIERIVDWFDRHLR